MSDKTESLRIYVDTFNLFSYFYKVLRSVPRELRFTLGENGITLLYESIGLIRIANNDFAKRDNTLKELIDKLNSLKVIVRFFGENEIIKQKKATFIMLSIENICKQANSWRKSFKNKN